jgi:hypothetical protein
MADQVICLLQVDQMDLLQELIWMVMECLLLQEIWLVNQAICLQVIQWVNLDQWMADQVICLLQELIWMVMECLLLQVWRVICLLQVETHYLVKPAQLVDLLQVICLQATQWVNQDLWMADLGLRVICHLQWMVWMKCIRIWMMQLLKVQWDPKAICLLHQKVICQWMICLLLQQMTLQVTT